MIRGTTIPLRFTVSERSYVDFTQASLIIGKFVQGDVVLIKEPAVINEKEIQVEFSQEESLGFLNTGSTSPVAVQFNWLINGYRGASKLRYIDWEKQIYDEVIEAPAR